MNPTDPLVAPIRGAASRTIAGVQIDVVRTGGARVKRMIYPPGFRWSKHMKDSVGTDLCQHAHVGFLAEARSTSNTGTGASWNWRLPRQSPSSRDTMGGS